MARWRAARAASMRRKKRARSAASSAREAPHGRRHEAAHAGRRASRTSPASPTMSRTREAATLSDQRTIGREQRQVGGSQRPVADARAAQVRHEQHRLDHAGGRDGAAQRRRPQTRRSVRTANDTLPSRLRRRRRAAERTSGRQGAACELAHGITIRRRCVNAERCASLAIRNRFVSIKERTRSWHPRPARHIRRRWWTLVVLSVSLLVISLDNTILNVALPTIERDLDASGERRSSGSSTRTPSSSPACCSRWAASATASAAARALVVGLSSSAPARCSRRSRSRAPTR